MQPHTIAAYDTDLKTLDEFVGEMARRAETALADSARALFAGDIALAQRVIAGDGAIDMLQQGIEEKAISTIATRQPVAGETTPPRSTSGGRMGQSTRCTLRCSASS
jgi:phosphate transport system protein